MLEILRNAWKVEDLRKKILYTLMILLIFRLGSFIPIAGVDRSVIAATVGQNGILGLLDIISGGSFSNFTIFAMGISPYINASIIMNLLTVAIPKLSEIAKDGDEGRKKIEKYTRYFTVVLGFVQAVGILAGLQGAVIGNNWFSYVTIGLSLAAGTALVMWLGERINDKGIGNGISLLIFVSIISRIPVFLISMVQRIANEPSEFWTLPVLLVAVALIIAGVVFVDLGERRVPVQYAKRVVGRKQYGGQSTHIPMKVNSSGVLPLIFAMSLVSFPQMIASFWPESGFYRWYTTYLGTGTWTYGIVFALLILAFTFFYVSISFNPVDISKNLQQYSGFIPGIRPGRPTSDYLHRISMRLTLFGGIFLAILATVPMVATQFIAGASMFGATSVLIMVNVALETSRQLESQMLMRHYKGFLK